MRVFVYGTLTDRSRARRVVPDATFARDATLRGLHPVEGAYPTLAPGGETEGRVLETEHADALDEYEGVDRGLYVRVSVPVSRRDDRRESRNTRAGSKRPVSRRDDRRESRNTRAGSKRPASADESVGEKSVGEESDAASVDVYVGDPAKLDAPADWPEGPFPECVYAYLDGHDVHVD